MEEKQVQHVNSEEIDLLEVRDTIWDSRKFIAIFVGIITLSTGIVSFLLPKTYTSEAVIVSISKEGGGGTLSVLSQLAGLPLEDKSQSNIKAVLESNALRESVVKELNLVDEILKKEKDRYRYPYSVAAQKLKEYIKTSVSQKDGTISIKVDWKNPETAQEINLSIINNLRQILNEKAFSIAKMNRIFYETEANKTSSELKEAIEKLNQFQKEKQVILPENKLQSQLQLYASLLSEKLKLEAEKSSYSNLYNSDHPKIREISSRLSFLSQKIAEVEGDINSNSPISTEKTLSVIPEYISLYLDVQKLKLKYEVLSKLLEQARIDELKENLYVEVIDSPSYPEKPSKPKKELMVAVAFVGSLFLAVFIVLLRKAILSRKGV
ncbi:MAG: Wzz/FepE/Etk N-terminal domain-containing protein [Hydrogenothermaceae bacterium]|nr:Wzz/FepE/Etk N-terminal domain-containing protein [Hydrogenothermaceae bacterium]